MSNTVRVESLLFHSHRQWHENELASFFLKKLLNAAYHFFCEFSDACPAFFKLLVWALSNHILMVSTSVETIKTITVTAAAAVID
jgi:hypothetical protein